MVLHRLTLRPEPPAATKPAHTQRNKLLLSPHGLPRGAGDVILKQNEYGMQFLAWSSRSSLIASFRSAAAGDENRAPWVLAPGKALQVNNKPERGSSWGFDLSLQGTPAGVRGMLPDLYLFYTPRRVNRDVHVLLGVHLKGVKYI